MHSIIREAVAKMVENSMSLLVVLSTTENTPIGIVCAEGEDHTASCTSLERPPPCCMQRLVIDSILGRAMHP